MQIEIVYWDHARDVHLVVALPQGSSVTDALREAGLLDVAADWIRHSGALGIRGRLASYDQLLEDQDRIEFLRPLQAPAQERRREQVRLRRAKSPSRQFSSGGVDDPGHPTVAKNDPEVDNPRTGEMAGFPVEDVCPAGSRKRIFEGGGSQ